MLPHPLQLRLKRNGVQVSERDHRIGYWLGGLVSSVAIFLEKKSRREELGLYVLPRAVESVWISSGCRSVRGMETVLYALSVGWLLHVYQHNHANLAPVLGSIFRTVLPTRPPQEESLNESL